MRMPTYWNFNEFRSYTTIGTPLEHEYENTLTKTFMRDKLTIKIWPMWDLGNGLAWSGHISFRTMAWYLFEWDIPHDLYEIAKDLGIRIDMEAAKIIYDQIRIHFNQTLCDLQILDGLPLTSNVTQVMFPPFEEFENDIRRHRIPTTVTVWWTPTTYIGNTPLITAYHSDYEERMSRLEREMRERNSMYDRMVERYREQDNRNHMDNINYMTQEEYEQKREAWELEANTMYLVYN